MRSNFLLIGIMLVLILTACSKETATAGDNVPANAEKGIVKGRITDSKGNPIANASVVVEHTVYYGTYHYATSDANGYYKVNVSAGSWRVSVQIQRDYLDRTYKFDLHPDNAQPFAGIAGAVRNFTWVLNGSKPGGGFYGSSVALYPEPGSELAIEDIELTLMPDGSLADGSIGLPITKGLIDIGGGEDGINDIPIGKYDITARNKSTNQPLQIRMRNAGVYSSSVKGMFTSGFTGSTSYQIQLQVK